jgi:hypothetical protein
MVEFFIGVLGNGVWSAIENGGRWIARRRVAIVHPRPGEALTDDELKPGGWKAYDVRGTLRKLPAGHEMWLLLEEDEKTGEVRPQGFYPVNYNRDDGTWRGKINGTGRDEVKIVAVVAPPTSVQMFKQYQQTGEAAGHKCSPLKAIPPECRNRAWVHARIR